MIEIALAPSRISTVRLSFAALFAIAALFALSETAAAQNLKTNSADKTAAKTEIKASPVVNTHRTINFLETAAAETQLAETGEKPEREDEPGEPGKWQKRPPEQVVPADAFDKNIPLMIPPISNFNQLASPTAASSFIALPDQSVGGSSYIPPDTHGAAGLNHLLVSLNSQVRIQNKTTGAVISTVSLNSFFAATGMFDPKVVYDPYASRWYFTALNGAQNASSAVLLAVSQTNDPTGTWDIYTIDADTDDNEWADYPSIGFNKDYVDISINMFTFAGTSTEVRHFTFTKASLTDGIVGATSFRTSVASATCGFTSVPAVTFDNSISTLYLMSNFNGNSGGNGFLRLCQMTGTPPAAPTFAAVNFVQATGAPWGGSAAENNAPQSGATTGIMTNDSRLQNVVYRNGSLWTTHQVFLPAALPTHVAVQWWQITPTGTVTQRGRIEDTAAAPTTHYAFPSIAVNATDRVLIGYSRFSGSQFAGANYAYRAPYDAANTMRDDTVMKAGEGCYLKTFSSTRNRWGDYSSTVIDPSNDSSMWTLQEYAGTPVGTCTTNNTGKWSTWWVKIDNLPTAAAVSVGGVVNRAGGVTPLKNVMLTLQSVETGASYLAQTDARGRYRFDDIPGGKTYVLTPTRKDLQFNPVNRLVNANDSFNNVDFAAAPLKSER